MMKNLFYFQFGKLSMKIIQSWWLLSAIFFFFLNHNSYYSLLLSFLLKNPEILIISCYKLVCWTNILDVDLCMYIVYMYSG